MDHILQYLYFNDTIESYILQPCKHIYSTWHRLAHETQKNLQDRPTSAGPWVMRATGCRLTHQLCNWWLTIMCLNTSYACDISHTLATLYHPYAHEPLALTEYLKRKLQVQHAKRRSHSHPAQVEPNVPLECNTSCLVRYLSGIAIQSCPSSCTIYISEPLIRPLVVLGEFRSLST